MSDVGELRGQVGWHQYDAEAMTWDKEGGADSPYRQFLARYILPFVGNEPGKNVLDVGCGTGWLLTLLAQKGVTRLVGVEPSKYANVARQTCPEAEIMQTAFETYQTEETFDLVTFIMSIEMIDDLTAALQKARQLLKPSGRIVICKGNYDYFLADKYDYELTREEYIPGQETVVRTDRPTGYGTTIDIYRSVERVVEQATQAGLALGCDPLPVAPDEQAIADIPRYAVFAQQPLLELMEFKTNA